MGISSEFRKYRKWEESEKKEAVYRVLIGELTKKAAMETYGIRGSSGLDRWIEKYGHGILIEHKDLFEQIGVYGKRRGMKKKTTAKNEGMELTELKGRIRELEKALEKEKLRSEAYSTMIDLAEEQLKVQIRKKSDTKQSRR